jgi:hypothetical protein
MELTRITPRRIFTFYDKKDPAVLTFIETGFGGNMQWALTEETPFAEFDLIGLFSTRQIYEKYNINLEDEL